MNKNISDHGRNVAAEEMTSLLNHGYRTYGSMKLKTYEAYFLRHTSNGHKARVILTDTQCRVFINQKCVQITEF